MKKLKRSRCVVLSLVLKRQWYDLIASDARDGLCVAKRKYGDESLQKMFLAQIERCAEICNRIVEQGDKTYTPKEVLAIIDELLDGIRPKKGEAKQ